MSHLPFRHSMVVCITSLGVSSRATCLLSECETVSRLTKSYRSHLMSSDTIVPSLTYRYVIITLSLPARYDTPIPSSCLSLLNPLSSHRSDPNSPSHVLAHSTYWTHLDRPGSSRILRSPCKLLSRVALRLYRRRATPLPRCIAPPQKPDAKTWRSATLCSAAAPERMQPRRMISPRLLVIHEPLLPLPDRRRSQHSLHCKPCPRLSRSSRPTSLGPLQIRVARGRGHVQGRARSRSHSVGGRA